MSKDNSWKREINGQIVVQLPKSGYVSGETIQGTICINLEEKYEGHILQVTLEGIEDIKFNYCMTEKRRKKDNQKKEAIGNGNDRFVDYSIPIYDFSQGAQASYVLMPGQWQIPFEIGLAAKLPPSLDHFEDTNNYCNLKYQIIASIIPTNDSIKPLQGQYKIRVSKVFNNHLGVQSKQQDFFSESCCGSGQYRMFASIDRSEYFPGDTLKIAMNSDLSFYRDKIKYLDVELVGFLTLKPSEQGTFEKVVRIFQVGQEVSVPGEKIKEEISLVIPRDIKQSCEAHLISLEYVVIIRPIGGNSCAWQSTQADSFRQIEFPIQISLDSQMVNELNAPPVNQGNLPQKWVPIQLSSAQLSPQKFTYIQQDQARFAQINQVELQNISEHRPIMQQQDQSVTYNQGSFYQ